MKLDFYYVSSDYLEFLKEREKAVRGFTCIPNTEYASGNTKFFYGTVLQINDINFFVPVSSKLHYKQDDMLIKGKDKKSSYLGTLRFRYMVPVPSNCLSLLVRDALSSVQGERVRKELAFCRRNRDKIAKQANVTYERVVNRVEPGLVRNSCDFKLLESAYMEWIAEKSKKVIDK
ncbi:MAG: type III toxin-antitoxin system ToxN/AbiQ family toxin [Clostridiales bacterium]|nr:type III toxin-antitoxin system ToxN/AbiQ family toxin [Clostridiales bacterium]